MTYSITTLAEAVRALTGIGPSLLKDAELKPLLVQAKRRLDEDRPRQARATITGTGKSSYSLAAVTSWEADFSKVLQAYNPTPDFSADDEPVALYPEDVRVYTAADDVQWIRFADPIGSSQTALIIFSARWTVLDLEDATSTTLTARYYNALEYAAAANACSAMAARNAGTNPRQHQANEFLDVLNVASRYQDQAIAFEKRYGEEISKLADKPRAAARMVAMDTAPSVGFGYLIHRRTIGG